MKQRWLVVAIGLPLLLLVLLACPAWATMLLVCAIAGIAAYELLHTAGENVPADFYWGLVTTVVMQEIWLFKEEMSGTYDLPISTVTIFRWILVMMAFLFAVISYGKEKPFTFHDVAVAIIGGIVFPAMYSCIGLLRNVSPAFVLMPFVIAFIGDSFSMLGGMAKVSITKDSSGTYISDYGMNFLVTHYTAGRGAITTYFLDNYTDELASQHAILTEPSEKFMEVNKNYPFTLAGLKALAKSICPDLTPNY